MPLSRQSFIPSEKLSTRYQLGAKSMIRKPQPHPRPKTLNFTCRWDKIGVLFAKPHPFQEEGNVCSFSNLRLINQKPYNNETTRDLLILARLQDENLKFYLGLIIKLLFTFRSSKSQMCLSKMCSSLVRPHSF